jgi:hypothetical protein
LHRQREAADGPDKRRWTLRTDSCLDLASGRSRRIAPDVTLAFGLWSFPLAVSADGQSVLFIAPSGNLQRVVSAPRDGSAGTRTHATGSSHRGG